MAGQMRKAEDGNIVMLLKGALLLRKKVA